MSAKQKMNFDAETLYEQLINVNLHTAAAYIVTGIGGGVYSPDFITASILFSTLPSPETGLVLVASNPSMWEILIKPHDVLMDEMVNDEYEFDLEIFNGWIETFTVNQRACDGIYEFLQKGLKNGKVTVHFEEPDYNHRLNDRLSLFGLKKGFFQRRINFLRERFLNDRRIFNAALDLICIHDTDSSQPHYWKATGESANANKFESSEVQYHLGDQGETFRQLVTELREAS